VPDPNDEVDVEVAKVVNTHKESIRIPILKVDKGYLVGSDI
jgi:hypothetical protein